MEGSLKLLEDEVAALKQGLQNQDPDVFPAHLVGGGVLAYIVHLQPNDTF